MTSVTIVDCGLSNIDSCVRALEYCDGDPIVTREPEVVRRAARIVLPGVGAFAEAMRRLSEAGLADAIREAAARDRPVLGICLGMQLLATRGHENGLTEGLDLVAGEVTPLEKHEPAERVPHIGWNTVEDLGRCALLQDVQPLSDFYFVHSYAFRPKSDDASLATTPSYGGFTSVVGKGAVFGAQFHPEKSQATGFQLLKNFIRL